MEKVKMALVYDFDKTLSPKDMQEFHLIQRFGYHDPKMFWDNCGIISKKHNMDGILSYMMLMSMEDSKLTKEILNDEGKYITLFKGVDTWFKRINEYASKKKIEIEHYIISSGIKEMIQGTSIANEFKKIYACSFCYDEEGYIRWPSRVVNYTTKTQYLFRINKGILDETNDIDLNKSTPEEEKYIPFSRMIYFGDGLTDVPSMKVVTDNGGSTIAVYQGDKEQLAEELKEKKRATFKVEADYSEDSTIDKIVKRIIDSISAYLELDEYR